MSADEDASDKPKTGPYKEQAQTCLAPDPNLTTHFHRKSMMPNLSMGSMRTGGLAVILLIAVLWPHVPSPLGAGSHMMGPMMQPRVPADKLAEARALTSPLPDSPEMIEKGKALYNGKGTCFNCHGKDGSGNGPVASQLNPSPRNFQHHGFWRHRTEGEIFWVIKHGSPGTSMIGFGNQLTDEEIWTIIQYERSFAGNGMGHRGPREGMGRMGPGGDACCDDQNPKP